MPRMRILSASEQTRIELPPIFDSAERKRYFDFSQSVIEAAQNLRDPDQVHALALPPTQLAP